MTQIATVERILDDTHAEISVPRKSACGHDCEECAGCGVSGVSVYVKALNTVGAGRVRRWWWRATRRKCSRSSALFT